MMTKTGPEMSSRGSGWEPRVPWRTAPFSAGGCEFAIHSETGVVWQDRTRST